MTRRRHRALAAYVVGALSLAASVSLSGGPVRAADEVPGRATSSSEWASVPAGVRASVHSSDGVVGPIAEPVRAALRGRVTVDHEKSYLVAPGLHFRQWDQTDSRGQIRAYLLTANLAKPGLRLEYASPRLVPQRQKLTRIMSKHKAVAGVNGDFFDISDTGAPLGVGVLGSAPRHGPAQNWDMSFVIGKDGVPAVRHTPMEAAVEEHPRVHITNVNSPHIVAQGIGVYTPRWGSSPGYATSDGARRADVRQVVVQEGVVVSNSRTVTRGEPIEGKVLIGRGAGATTLRDALPVGAGARVVIAAARDPRLAISGSTRLLHKGRRVTNDDGELHPRTAVGVDLDGRRILILVVDGRQDFSRGYTMVELARMLKQLGAEEALNLDGGGSSTMVTRRPSGHVRVSNSPSDGRQRMVPNGLQLIYKQPK